MNRRPSHTTRTIPRSLLVLLFLLPFAIPASVQAGTYYLYGAPQSLEGRFETATGEMDEQGWYGIQSREGDQIWQISDFNAANLNNHGAGNHAIWVGRTALQEPDWVNPPGYGNHWWTRLEWVQPAPDPGSPVTVGLEFYYNYDSEPTYDHLLVEWLADDEWRQLLIVSGSNRIGSGFPPPGEHFDQTWIVQPSEFSGPGGDEIRLRMGFFSETGISDEDGLPFPGGDTNGGAQLDDILVTFDGAPVDGGGDADGVATFESADTEGWTSVGATKHCSLWSAIPDQYPGAATNPTPTIAQVADASTGVISLTCNFWSPVIPWDVPEPSDGALLTLDVFNMVGSGSGPSWYEASLNYELAGVWGDYTRVLLATPHVGWQTVEVDLAGIVPDDATFIRLWLKSIPQGPSNVIAFDNVTVVRFDTAVGAMPLGPRASTSIERVYPNPANPKAIVDFRTSVTGPVRVTVYDTRGRLVRTLLDHELPAGLHTVEFDGRDSHDASVASGMYLVQLETPTATIARRLTLVR